ncbi:hypothetical protein ES708_26743 [subsurface metagenome]
MLKKLKTFFAIFLALLFLSQQAGISITRHFCNPCQSVQINLTNHVKNIFSLDNHSHNETNCKHDAFHHKHQNHNKTCSNQYLKITGPFKLGNWFDNHSFQTPVASIIAGFSVNYTTFIYKSAILKTLFQKQLSGTLLHKICRLLI